MAENQSFRDFTRPGGDLDEKMAPRNKPLQKKDPRQRASGNVSPRLSGFPPEKPGGREIFEAKAEAEAMARDPEVAAAFSAVIEAGQTDGPGHFENGPKFS